MGTLIWAEGCRIPCAFSTTLLTRRDIDTNLDHQPAPHNPLDLPQCYSLDRRSPLSFQEAMGTEHAHLWKDSTARKLYGLLDAGTLEPV